MPILSTPTEAFGAAAHPGLFGGNILAPRAHMTGPQSYAEAIEALGVTTLRYPGGSLTEDLFDLRNPDATFATDPDTGQVVVKGEPLQTLSRIHGDRAGRPMFGQNLIPDGPGEITVGDRVEVLESGPSNVA